MKMQKTFIAIVLLCLVTAAANAQTKVATIDLRKVFDNYYKTKQADTLLKGEAKDLEDQRQEMLTNLKKGEDEWKKLVDKANDQAISADERDKSKKDAEKKYTQLKSDEQTLDQFERSSRAKLAEKQRQKRDLILEEIRDAISAKAKTGGYSMVIDVAAESVNNTPVILYTDPASKNDLTDEILSQINAGAPSAPAPSSDKSGSTDKPADTKSDKK